MFAPVGAGPGKPAYAGAIVRQGEATGQVTATGSQTFFGRTAELVRSSDAPSHMQRTIFAIVKRLVIFDAVLAALVVAFALWHHLPPADTAVFVLMLMVASVPVALPATYTLGTAVSSMQLAHQGVLVTRLPAVEEAAAMDTLVSDKTGTLTQNTLTLAGVIVLAAGSDESAVLRAAALASDDATQDPLDLAILAPARAQGLLKAMLVRQAFHPFDPTTRRSEGVYLVDGNAWHAVKGASNVIGPLCKLGPDQQAALDAAERMLAESGARVLAVAAGPDAALQLLGVVGLADPPRSDAADLIAQLTRLGVRVRMATGDALETARAIGTQLGLGTRVCEAQGDALQDPENCDLFTLNKTLKTLEIVVFLTLGLMLTGSFVISSTLIVLLLFTNDFVTMTIATDRVQPADLPQRWQVQNLMAAAAVFAGLSLLFTFPLYWWLRRTAGLDASQMQTVVFLLLVFTNQACIHVLRSNGRLWSFAPGRWMILASVGDVLLVSLFALMGWLMAALPFALIAGLVLACVMFALVLNQAKKWVFVRFAIA
jgi:magnesium-transporting ATPase (P-type)